MARGCIRCYASKKRRVISFIKPANCFTSEWNLTMRLAIDPRALDQWRIRLRLRPARVVAPVAGALLQTILPADAQARVVTTARLPLSTRAAAAAPCKQFPLVLARGVPNPGFMKQRSEVFRRREFLTSGIVGATFTTASSSSERPRLRYALTIDALVQSDRAFLRQVV